VNQAVSIGDDGRPPGSDDGPLLAALKGWAADMHAQYRATLEALILRDRQQRYLETPNAVPLQAGGVVPASGVLVLDLGAPQLGRRWLVRRLAVANGLAVRTVLAGIADWYVGQPPAGNGISNPAGWQWTFPTLPNVSTFSSESIVAIPSDHLYAVITTGTAGQLAVASATVLDYAADPSSGPAVQVV
jgi:hypothetical protein